MAEDHGAERKGSCEIQAGWLVANQRTLGRIAFGPGRPAFLPCMVEGYRR